MHSETASTKVLLPESTGTISAPKLFILKQLIACLAISFVPIKILHFRLNFAAAILNIFPAYPAPVSPTIYFFPSLLANNE